MTKNTREKTAVKAYSLRRKGCLFRTAGLILGAFAALLLAEAGVRIFWKNAPRDVRPFNDPILVQSPNIREGFRLRPGARGRYHFADFSFNAQGLRDREIDAGKPPGVRRVLMMGDSFVYGVGLPADATLPAALGRTLDSGAGRERFQVINAGVPGNNFTQEVENLRRLAPVYRPDAVIFVLIYNDTETKGFSPYGWLPVFNNWQKDSFSPPKPWRKKVFDFLLPPGQERWSQRLRFALAEHSRLYLFAAMRFYYPPPPVPKLDRTLAHYKTPSCRNEAIIYEPFRENLAAINAMARQYGFSPFIVFYMDFFMDGELFLRLDKETRGAGIPDVNLTYLWKNETTYLRRHSLGWDRHPNREANRIASAAIAGFLSRNWNVSHNDKWNKYFQPDAYDGVHAQREKYHEARRREHDREFEKISQRFSTDVAFGAGGFDPDQILYGWWDEDVTYMLGRPGVHCLAVEASVFLKNPGKAETVRLSGVVPVPLGTPGDAPRVAVFINCRQVFTSEPIKDSEFTLDVPVPRNLREYPILEIGVAPDLITTAANTGGNQGDNRVIGLGIRQIRLIGK